jgi:hypothetical protein
VKGDENTNFVAQNQEEYYDKMQSLAMRSSRSYPVEVINQGWTPTFVLDHIFAKLSREI